MHLVQCSACRTESSVAFYRQRDKTVLCNSCNWLAFEKKNATLYGKKTQDIVGTTSVSNENVKEDAIAGMDKDKKAIESNKTTKGTSRASARISAAVSGATSSTSGYSIAADREKRSCILPRRTAISKGKGRRSMFKSAQRMRPSRLVHAEAGLTTVDWCLSRNHVWHKGDIVSARDADSGEIFYAQITGLLKQPDFVHAATVCWLLPLSDRDLEELRRHFDPTAFVLGPYEEYPRPLDQFEFVCHASPDYYVPQIGPFASQGTLTDCILTSIRTRPGDQNSKAEVFGVSQQQT